MVAGLDPALKAPTGYAVLETMPQPRLVEAGESGLYQAIARARAPLVGVDAPLHPPYSGFRRVEKRAVGFGARLLPGGTPGMRSLARLGVSIHWLLRETGRRPLETHPASVARLIGVERSKVWRRAGGRHVGDAVLAALSALCYLHGKAIVIEDTDGLLVLPKKTRYCVKILWETLG